MHRTKWQANYSIQFPSLESADAVGVTKGIRKGLEAIDIDNELLKEKLARCTFDGASVMMAERRGLIQQLQPKILRPVIVIHCVAHRKELAVVDAIKTCSYLNSFEDTINYIFEHSQGRCCLLQWYTEHKTGMALGFFTLGPRTHMSGQIGVPSILCGSQSWQPCPPQRIISFVMRKSDWQITVILFTKLYFLFLVP